MQEEAYAGILLGELRVVQAATARGKRSSKTSSRMALFLAPPADAVLIVVTVEVIVDVTTLVDVVDMVLVEVADTTLVDVVVTETVEVDVEDTMGVEVVVTVDVTGQGVKVFLKKELQSADP